MPAGEREPRPVRAGRRGKTGPGEAVDVLALTRMLTCRRNAPFRRGRREPIAVVARLDRQAKIARDRFPPDPEEPRAVFPAPPGAPRHPFPGSKVSVIATGSNDLNFFFALSKKRMPKDLERVGLLGEPGRARPMPTIASAVAVFQCAILDRGGDIPLRIPFQATLYQLPAYAASAKLAGHSFPSVNDDRSPHPPRSGDSKTIFWQKGLVCGASGTTEMLLSGKRLLPRSRPVDAQLK